MSSIEMRNQRIAFLDTSKCILILLVILGHILEHYMTEGSMQMSTFNFIFSFAMPAFITISGYFIRIEAPLKGIAKLCETYMVFQVFHSIIDLDFSPFRLMFFPKWTMWYLISLVWWKVAIYIYERFSTNIYALFVLSIILSILIPFIKVPVYFLAIERTVSYFPFFLLGVLLKKVDIEQFRRLRLVRTISVTIIIVSFVFALCYPMEMRWLYNWNSLYNSMPISLRLAPFIRLIAITGCSVLALSVMVIAPNNIETIQQEGKNSLFYYMWHSILLTIIFAFFKHFNVTIGFIESCGLWLAVIITLYAMSKVKLFQILLNPFTYFRKK